MIDHMTLPVSNFEKSKHFMEKALAPLGYRLLFEMDGNAAGFSTDENPDFWILGGEVPTPPTHVAFTSPNRATVNTFYEVAIATGGQDNGKPGLRSEYHPNYYSAYVLDPDGHNIEAVCHAAEG